MTFQVGNHEIAFNWNYGVIVGIEIIPWFDIHNQNKLQHVWFQFALGVFTFGICIQVRPQA